MKRSVTRLSSIFLVGALSSAFLVVVPSEPAEPGDNQDVREMGAQFGRFMSSFMGEMGTGLMKNAPKDSAGAERKWDDRDSDYPPESRGDSRRPQSDAGLRSENRPTEGEEDSRRVGGGRSSGRDRHAYGRPRLSYDPWGARYWGGPLAGYDPWGVADFGGRIGSPDLYGYDGFNAPPPPSGIYPPGDVFPLERSYGRGSHDSGLDPGIAYPGGRGLESGPFEPSGGYPRGWGW